MALFGRPNVEELRAAGNVHGLVKALGYRRDPSVREAAAQVLVKLGEPAVPPLIAALRGRVYPPHLDKDTREAIVTTLVQIRWLAVDPLTVALTDTTAALGRLGPVLRSRPFARLRDRYYSLIRSITEALGQIGSVRAAEPLVTVLMTGDENVRRDVVAALRMIRPAAVVESLVNAFQDAALEGRWVAAWALGEIGDIQGISPLVDALNDDDQDVRWAAAAALGRIGDAQAVSSLFMALRNWQQDRHILIQAMGQIIDTRSVNALISALNDRDLRVCLDAAKALVQMYRSGRLREADKQAIEAQREAMARIERQVRERSP